MSFRHIITFCIFCWIGMATALYGQNIIFNDNDLLHPDELLEQETQGNGNEAFIQQVGDENQILVEQSLIGEGNNLIKTLQQGDDNFALIVQEGLENKLALIQRGDDNYYRLINEAEDNLIVVIQQGNNNQIVQELIGSDQVNVEFIQQGNDNEIIQILEGVDAKNYKVHQIGNGLRVLIRQSAY